MTKDFRAIGGVLFDKDGTLVDFEATWAPVNRAAGLMAAGGDAALAAAILDRCGVDPQTGRTRPESPMAIAGASEIAEAMARAGSRLSHDALVDGLHVLFAQGARAAQPIGDIAGMLARLKARGLKVGVASSDSAEGVATTIKALGVGHLVDFQCGYDSGFGPKPQPGMVKAFCAATGLSPAEVAMVGDSTHDLHMGRAAGCGLVAGVLSGTGVAGTLRPLCDVLIDSVAELPALLSGEAH